MSSGGPLNPDKGKKVAKPKRAPKRPRKVPPTRPSTSSPSTLAGTHSAALQSTSVGLSPIPLPSPTVPAVEPTPPPIMVPIPPLVMVPTPPPLVPTPPPVMVPTPPPLVPTPPPVMVPTPRPPVVPTPPPVMVPMPPPVVLSQPSSSPSEEFENRLSQVRSEQGSCVGPLDPNVDPTAEDTIRTRCWVEVVGGKNKGRVYGAGQLAANSGASGSLRRQPSSSSSSAEDVTYLRQRLEARDQAYEELKGQFQNLHNLVLTLLPPDHRALQQPQSSITLVT
ncbi:hypothetical protein DEO72_LG3g734 [Vigna unguiculata]|uniref:Uncharacterized protein n=1 Tax=Vigna unguiculata TaxID=3917 RepID=A0A4D6LCJ7_VIGUN|nr:hypothetical protein DEO72_LG3g734 [Vigna unguiculata]